MNNAWKINEGDRSYGKGWSNAGESSAPKGGMGASRGGARGAGAGAPASRGGAARGGAQAKAEEPPMNYSEK